MWLTIWYSCPIAENITTYYINTMELNHTYVITIYFLTISHIKILPLDVWSCPRDFITERISERIFKRHMFNPVETTAYNSRSPLCTVFFHNSDNIKYTATGGRNAYLCVTTFRNLNPLVSCAQICGAWYSLLLPCPFAVSKSPKLALKGKALPEKKLLVLSCYT
jgi:hypothetical protein